MGNVSRSTEERSEELWYAKAMEQLVEVVQQLSLARELDTVMDIVRKAARKLTEADGATFVLRDGDKCFYADEDAIAPLWKGRRFPMSACISGWAMLNKKPAVIEDIYADPRIPADAYRPTFVKSLAMVPIRTIKPVGAIGIYWAERRNPSAAQVRILQALADTTAVVMENVSVYSELEMRVRQRTSELQVILDNVQVGIVFSVNGRIVRANPKSAEMFRLGTPEAMLGMPTETLLRTPAFDSARTLLSEDRVFDAETKLVRRDGTEFWARMLAKSLESEKHQGGEIWVVNDVSEAKAKEKVLDELRVAAEEATQFKSEFLATMSHEIRTPLTGMLGMLELLSLTGLDDEQCATLNAAWDSGRGLLRIVNDILDWSKIEEGKLALSPRATSIPDLLQASVNTYSRIASAKGLLLRQRADSRLASAYIVDPLRLSQVLNNFVSNAIKFTQSGEIELSAEFLAHMENGDRMRVSVRDTGIGIPRDVQERLFQRYRQESADTARMYGGTGLGLSICRRLAELMDGTIELESEPGRGSVFSISLVLPISAAPGEPTSDPHPEVAQRAVRPLLEGGGNAPQVLAVDDHPINRDLLARQIRLLGLRAETAENGEAALAMWREGRFSMVITDCHMPEMDGYELSQAIRRIESEEARPHTPIIAWTANALVEESARCHSAGMDELLVKPAGMAQLRDILAKWLGMAGNDPVDLEVLGMVVTDGEARIHLLKDFLKHIRTDRERLLEMFGKGDRAGVESTVHRMKGSSMMIGAKHLADACGIIEKSARDGDMDGAVRSIETLDEAMGRFEAYLVDETQETGR